MRVGLLLPVLVVIAPAGLAQPAGPRPTPVAAAKPTKPTPAPPPVLEGVVRGPDKKPIERALVVALPEAQPVGGRFSFDRRSPVAARTDAAGRFRLALRANEPHTVRVEALGLAAAVRKDVSPGAPLAFDLTAGLSIEGTVRDGETGQPAPGLRVVARQTNAIPVPDLPESGRVVARTDGNGRFKLQGLASGLFDVSASGRGRGSAARSAVRPGRRVDLVVLPSASLYGTVSGADGRPVPGATVTAAPRPWGLGTTETTDDHGAYELNGLLPGAFDIVARAPGLAPSVASDVVLERRTEARVDLVLRPGTQVVGRLVDGDEHAVGGRVVIGELDGRPLPRILAEPFTTEAGRDGRFTIEGVPPGEHALGVTAPGFARERVDAAVRAGDRRVDVGDVRLESGITIRGRVRSKAGQPIAGAVLAANAMRRRMGEWIEARSEVDGGFVLAGLEPGLYRVSANADGFGTGQQTAEAGGDPVEIVLAPSGTITGRVVDERSQPVGAFRVTARAAETAGPMMRAGRGEETTSEDGRFTLADLGAGTYVVTVSAPEYATATSPSVKVDEGGTVDVGAVKLTAGGIVRGTVVDPVGAAVAGASVSARAAGEDWQMGPPAEVTTDTAGAFELKGVSPGDADVVATHPSYATASPVPVKVDPARPTTDVRVVMSIGGRIEGSVRKRDGTPRTGLMVNAHAMAAVRPMSSASLSATTAADGSFAIEHVPAGRVALMVVPVDGSARSGAAMRTVEVRDGETATVEIVDREILLSGRITRSGSPGSGLRVEASSARGMSFVGGPASGAPPPPSTGPQRNMATTRDNGTFEMLVEEPGTYVLNATTVDGRVRLPVRRVEVPDADAHSVELTYEGVTVAGIVVDKETDGALPFASVSARPKEKDKSGTGGLTGPDGRFQLEVEPGEYALVASVRDGEDAPAETPVSVGDGGLGDVKLALSQGVTIKGTVTDPAGRPAAGVSVQAHWAAEGGAGWGFAESLPDGSFEIKALQRGSYTVVAEMEGNAYAIAPSVATGQRVALALKPGARLVVNVTDPAGAPAPDVYPSVTRVDGVRVGNLGRPLGATNAEGRTEVMVPAGALQVWAFKVTSEGRPRLGGLASVTIAPGERGSVAIRMTEGMTQP